MRITATVTQKGQVTIPKVIRNRIKSRVIEFIMDDDHIEIKPIQSVAGGLSHFATTYTPMEEVRQSVWGTHESD
ncbi:MAG: AbrB/MazE/SpoVT family DNA-binding domain-containing protein [Rectinemataceae bacterium]|nr:AbrB/MazE/SpoVT family DNA-binding domain-containing protein [Rectinemataceae bacterium]